MGDVHVRAETCFSLLVLNGIQLVFNYEASANQLLLGHLILINTVGKGIVGHSIYTPQISRQAGLVMVISDPLLLVRGCVYEMNIRLS